LSARGRYREAARVLRGAIALAERALGQDHCELAVLLNDLAVCYKYLARFLDAGPLYQRALRITERALGPDHPDVASIYHNLGGLEHAAGNWTRGEPFARRSVAIRTRALGAGHPDVAADLTALAALLDQQRKYDEAERLYRRALRILERTRGPRHHLVAVTLNNLAAVHQARGAAPQAEALYRRALEIDTAALGPAHPKVAFELNNLAVLASTARPEEAAALFRRALAIFRRALGRSHPNVGICLENFAPVLRALGRQAEADMCERGAERILSRVETINDEGVALTGTINPERARFVLSVKPSRIHRVGVFADEPIPRGRRVIEFTGQRVRRVDAIRGQNPRLAYTLALDRRWMLDGAIGGSGAEYINHSCEPNLRARTRGGRIWYVSARPIAKGEELTVDYKSATDTDMPCRCGAPSCRGTMARRPTAASRG
jgi:tetratricopeptide (TPR) repeat protein